MISRRVLLGAAIPLAAVASLRAHAEGTYPDHAIKLLVPFPPGALTDTLGRMVADRLQPALGQPVVVENRAGAGTLLGASVVAKSPPDGYNLMVATSTTLAISPAMFTNPPAVPSDFTGVAMIGTVSLLLVTRPDMKVSTLPQLVALMRSSPKELTFASPGTGTMHHLIVEMIKSQEKVKATHVPYQGSIAAFKDVATGRVDFMFLDAVAALPQIAAGKLNAIAVAASRRMPQLPNVPTVAESYPAIDLQAWQSIAAPKATPAAIVNRLNTEINRALDSPAGRAALLKAGVDANPMTPEQLNELIASDSKRLGDLVHSLGLKAA